MSKTIKERSKDLQIREKTLKLNLENSENDLRKKAKNAGKIALIAGLVTVLGYWIYQAFFASEEEEEKPKQKKERKRTSGISGTLLTYALPYLTKFLDDFLEIGDLKKEVKQDLSKKKSEN